MLLGDTRKFWAKKHGREIHHILLKDLATTQFLSPEKHTETYKAKIGQYCKKHITHYTLIQNFTFP